MQFIAITAILAAALSASASPLEARRAPSVIGHFYSVNDGCNKGDLRQTFEFEQDTTGTCHELVVPFQFENTKFTDNTLTKPIEFYAQPGCLENTTGHFQIVPKGREGQSEGCNSQKFRYYKTIL